MSFLTPDHLRLPQNFLITGETEGLKHAFVGSTDQLIEDGFERVPTQTGEQHCKAQ